MKLMTQEIRKATPALYSTEGESDPMVQAKFFTPWSNWTWYVIEFDGEDRCFGLVDGQCEELGYFSLRELEELAGPVGLKIERDLYWSPRPLSEVRKS